MGTAETISSLISLLAIIVAFLAYWNTRAFQERQNQLADVVEELSRKQIQNLDGEEGQRRKAVVSAEIHRSGQQWMILVRNSGKVPAKDVELILSCPEGGSSPLLKGDCEAKFPAPFLHPGGTIKLYLGVSHETARTFIVRLKWKDPDGTSGDNECFLSL